MKKYLLLLAFLLIIPSAFAIEGSTTLLAVQELRNGTFEGSVANLHLEIRKGSGRVFLDTFPLTKADTQISMRFAKEVACNFLEKDCSKSDFIYTIRAGAPIIGGPSAGAAAAVLTAALLENLKINPDIAITGTINSGGLIGPVGGLKAKINAGTSNGAKIILIPEGERFVLNNEVNQTFDWNIDDGKLDVTITNTSNQTDLVQYGLERGSEVREISTLNDALFEVTGKLVRKNNKVLQLDQRYSQIMKTLASDLCKRSQQLKDEISNITQEVEQLANLTNQAQEAFEQGLYYSSASYCFGANVRYSYFALRSKENQNITKIAAIVKSNSDLINDQIEKKKKLTITDIESYNAVKERLLEANDFLEQVNITDSIDGKLYAIAYASERVYSAKSWYSFFIGMGKKFKIDDTILKQSCQNKIAEAEERYQYATLVFPIDLEPNRQDIDRAYENLAADDYELCLFKASKAKAETNILLSLLGVSRNQLDGLIERKLEIVKQNIIRESEKDIFPIQSYSYYEYANALKETDKYSALLYAEYALELANLDLYFTSDGLDIGKELLISGILLILATILTFRRRLKPEQDTKYLAGKKR